MNDNAAVDALIIAVRHDLSRGLRRDEILKSLSRTVSRDLFERVRERV